MKGEIERDQWRTYLDEFSKRNAGRAADLEVLSEELGSQEEAQMVPFESITLETKGSTASSIEIMLAGQGPADDRKLTHTVTQVERIVPKIGVDGRDEALEIEAEDGTKIILVFKELQELAEAAESGS